MSLINLFKRKKEFVNSGFQNSEGLHQDIPNIKIIIDDDETLYQEEIREIKEMGYKIFTTGGADSLDEGIIAAAINYDFIYKASKTVNNVMTLYLKSKEKIKIL